MKRKDERESMVKNKYELDKFIVAILEGGRPLTAEQILRLAIEIVELRNQVEDEQ